MSDNGFLRIAAFTIDSNTGTLTSAGTVPAGNNPLGLAVHSSGKFLYVSDWNSGTGNVLAYSIDGSSGALNPIVGSPFAAGPQPVDVALDPSGKFAYVALVGGPSLAGFTVDSTAGALVATAGYPFPADNPTEIAVDSSGKFLYITNQALNTVGAYTLNTKTGALSAVPGAPFASGTGPVGLAVAVTQ